MAPGSHAFLSWWAANTVPIIRRDRLVVFLAGVLPDLDGITLFFSVEAYLTWHHVLCHNLLSCLVWMAVVAAFTQRKVVCATLAALNFHLHLACDYFGSAGFNDATGRKEVWVLPYLYPLVGKADDTTFHGPAWYWNPWQWPLQSWPNHLVTVLGLFVWGYIAVRRDRTWFEFIWPHADHVFCAVLRRWTRGKAVDEWPPWEGRFVRWGYLTLCVVAIMACLLAASQVGRAPR